MFRLKIKNRIFTVLLGILLFVCPIACSTSLNARNIFSYNNYPRKTLRIVGALGLISLCAEGLIAFTRKEKEFDFYSFLAIWSGYQGFKSLSQEL